VIGLEAAGTRIAGSTLVGATIRPPTVVTRDPVGARGLFKLRVVDVSECDNLLPAARCGGPIAAG
jgi:hypothetical protein